MELDIYYLGGLGWQLWLMVGLCIGLCGFYIKICGSHLPLKVVRKIRPEDHTDLP